MINPVLPSQFVPIVAQYSYKDPGGVIRTEVAGGANRYALDWARGVQPFSVTLILNALQLSVWEAFYHLITQKGAITFDMNLDSGFGVQPHACNIVPGSYNAARTGGILTAVSFVVEAESKVYDMTAADGASLVDMYGTYGDGLPSFFSRLAVFATADSNVLDF